MRTLVRRCNAGEVRCVYLESDAGFGKSVLISALSKDPGIRKKSVIVMKAPTGEEVDIEGRDVNVVKIQVCATFGVDKLVVICPVRRACAYRTRHTTPVVSVVDP